ncbi:MAG TPA: hypothetical protein VFR88_07735 [Microlunatus sp.]|nr:hypothetical protein [Microlunatus sp.]
MSAIDDILANIPINSLADQLGVDPATAESAVREALPADAQILVASGDAASGTLGVDEAVWLQL